MGRKVNADRLSDVVRTIQQNDGRVRANDIAKELKLHPQAVTRLLAVVNEETGALLYEDDRGFLGIFKRWW
jgi:Mn-dependent DtxR family transcriptional regulator